jgi:hypothetical protein
MDAMDVLGFAASALVFLSFTFEGMRALRLVAIAGNCVFIAYGIAAWLFPVILLHALLLPLNLHRLYVMEPKPGQLTSRQQTSRR